MRRVELTEAVALGTASRLHRVGILPAPASELMYAVYPWAVDSRTLRAVGWQPAYDNSTCVGVLLDSIKGRHALAARRVNRKDAALGAASAAVALVGTAAAVRRARKGARVSTGQRGRHRADVVACGHPHHARCRSTRCTRPSSDDRAGAIVLFVGAVRDLDHGKAVELVEYTCHPSARDAAQRLAERLAGHGQVLRSAVVHRVGRLAVGDLAVVAAVGAVHRAEAFEVCRSLIDELKATVPIWKHQVFTDGTDEWVGVP